MKACFEECIERNEDKKCPCWLNDAGKKTDVHVPHCFDVGKITKYCLQLSLVKKFTPSSIYYMSCFHMGLLSRKLFSIPFRPLISPCHVSSKATFYLDGINVVTQSTLRCHDLNKQNHILLFCDVLFTIPPDFNLK